MAKNLRGATALTGGGTGALDAIDGSILNDLDMAVVILLNKFYLYSLDADSAAAENSPFIISPDANAGDKRWILCKITDTLETLTAEPWTQQFNNLLQNGSFESWSAGAAAAPDGWALNEGTVAREATIIRIGEYSAKLTRVGTNCYLSQTPIATIDADTNTYWRGRKVTLGCWVYATVADRADLVIGDGVGSDSSSLHPGDSTWHFLTVTRTLDANATSLGVQLRCITGDTSVYFDGAILVEGTIAPAFAPKPAEHVAGWMDWVPTLTGDCDLSGYDTARFYRIGNLCFFYFFAGTKNVTTAGAKVEVTLPFTAANTNNQSPTGQVHDGTIWVGQTLMQIITNSNTLTVYKTAAAGGWAGTEVGITFSISGFYEIKPGS